MQDGMSPDETARMDGQEVIEAAAALRELAALFDGLPVTHGRRRVEVLQMGNADEDYLSASALNLLERMAGERTAEERASVPQAQFVFTDFTAPLAPRYVELAASLLCREIESAAPHAGECGPDSTPSPHAQATKRPEPQQRPDFVVSLGKRGAGALAQAVALRLDVPYSLSNWYPQGSEGDVRVDCCIGIGGAGWVFLNGIPPKSRVAIVVDSIRTGVNVQRLVEGVMKVDGCRVTGIYTVVEIAEGGARARLQPHAVPLRSLVQVTLVGTHSAVLPAEPLACKTDADDEHVQNNNKFDHNTLTLRRLPRSFAALLKALPADEVERKVARVARSFVGVPVVTNQLLGYPYCFFALTDFKPALSPAMVEDMADLAVHFGHFDKCDVLVSEGDRGGGPLLQAIGVRTGLPYVIASWSLDEASGVHSNVTEVGFSGSSNQLSLSGLSPTTRCAFVDDMLSSGGTADAILQCIQQLGAFTIETLFVSEKLYPVKDKAVPIRKGWQRLHKIFPNTTITCLIQFIVGSTHTHEPKCKVEK